MNTARYSGIGTGTQTAAIVAGGYQTVGNVETYNGSSWTETTDLNTARTQGGNNVGTYTATLFMSGATGSPSWPTAKTEVEQWDGSSWTEIADVNTGRRSASGSGTTTAAVTAGGLSSGYEAKTETWNGSSWTEAGDLNTARVYLASLGTSSTAAIAAAGAVPGNHSALVEQWNGSAWTEIADVNTSAEARSGSGSYTEGIVFGGDTPPGKKANTEHWDGSSWTEVSDLATARGYSAGQTGGSTAGAAAAAFMAGGYTTTSVATTEEFTAPSEFNQIQEGQLYFNSTSNTFKETITDLTGGTWASGGALNNGRTGVSGARNTPGHGTGLAMAGFTDTPSLTARGYTEEYNGTSWTEDTDMNTARGQTAGTGTSATAGIVYGGETYPPPVNKTDTETWNGSSWTEVSELNTAGRSMGNCGTTTAALAIGGTPAGDRVGKTEVWDGTSWTESGDVPSVPAGLSYNCAFGTTTAATTTGGGPGPAGYKRKAWSWTGSSWSEVAENNSDKTGGMAFGSNANSGFAFVSSTTEFWNGTSWTEVNDQSTGKTEGGSGGVSDSGLAFGGPSNQSATEEWTAGLANKTITAS
jgi:hypothetical protein